MDFLEEHGRITTQKVMDLTALKPTRDFLLVSAVEPGSEFLADLSGSAF